ncbi:MAG: GNAT family N-acetyltransferase [Thermoprotei archaeon]|nr:GNAT family N-acetyltransferase [Thermoprotei archaeon]
MPVEVRLATSEDKKPVAEMIARLKALNEELDPLFKTVENLEEVVEKYVEKTLEESKNCFTLVAYDTEHGELAGVIRIELVDRIFYKPRIKAVITDIYVRPKYRRKRVAALLLEKAKEEAKNRGAGMMTAVYPAGNLIAELFYENMGFKTLQLEKHIQL